MSGTTVRRLFVAIAAGVIAFSGLAAANSSASPNTTGTPGYCPDADGVTVVVDFKELGGGTVVRCAPGAQATGLAALENAGFVVTGTQRWGKAFVCRIDGKPTSATEPCIDTPPANAYWSYWHAPNGGSWAYSQQGASNRTPPPGSFEGWSFSLNHGPSDNPPPGVAPVRPAVAGPVTVDPVVLTGPAAARKHTAGATDAGAWLAGELVDGALPGFAGPDWGLTIDALFALSATGADPAALDAVATKVGQHVRSYNSYDDWGQPGVRIAGSTAKLLVGAVAAGRDPTDFGGYDLRAETLDLVAGADAGEQAGRVRDKGTGSDNSNTFAQALAVIGLARSGDLPQSTVDFLLKQQCGAGGFRLSPDMFGTPSASCDASPDAVLDPDSTAMAVQALLVAAESGADGAATAVGKAVTWLEGVQHDDGSFGGSGPTVAPNTNSTGLAGQALAAADRTASADRAADWVAARQLTTANGGSAAADDGAIAYNDTSLAEAVRDGIGAPQRDQWRRATTQAVLALAQVPLGDLGRDGGGEPGDAVTRVAAYLAGKLVDGDHVTTTVDGTTYVDYGSTVDAAYALLAAGDTETLAKVVAFLSRDEHVAAYAHGAPHDKPDANYVGATAKLTLLLALAGKDPTSVAGVDLVAELRSLRGEDGRFRDDSSFGDYANVFGQAFAVLALTATGHADEAGSAAAALVAARCADKTYPVSFPGENGCARGTADATGLAIQALNAVPVGSTDIAPDRKQALTEAANALAAARDGDGAWQGPGGQNVNSTGYATMGLLAVKQNAAASRAWLTGVRRDDGGLPVNPGQESNLLATAQALPALAGKSLLTTGRHLLDPATGVTDPGNPGPSPTPTATPDPSATPSVTATPSGGGGGNGGGSDRLPTTGVAVGALALAGLATLGAGVAVRAAARRRREEVPA